MRPRLPELPSRECSVLHVQLHPQCRFIHGPPCAGHSGNPSSLPRCPGLLDPRSLLWLGPRSMWPPLRSMLGSPSRQSFQLSPTSPCRPALLNHAPTPSLPSGSHLQIQTLTLGPPLQPFQVPFLPSRAYLSLISTYDMGRPYL